MSLFLASQAIDGIHQVGVYCLALVPSNTLPKTPLGGIHLSETKQLFLEGSLHPCNVLMCPHTCVTNLPKPRQKQPGKNHQTWTQNTRSEPGLSAEGGARLKTYDCVVSQIDPNLLARFLSLGRFLLQRHSIKSRIHPLDWPIH